TVMQPWFDDPADALRWIRQTAEGIVDGTVDPHWGANHIWSTALGPLKAVGPLRPFIDAGDRLDYSDRLGPEEVAELTSSRSSSPSKIFSRPTCPFSAASSR